MILRNIKDKQAKRGFTIVELLVVIVVIGILASITMVSYGGITARANTSSAKANASSLISKVNIYYADQGTWPLTYASPDAGVTKGAIDATSSSQKLGGLTLNTSALAAQPSSPNVITYYTCSTGSPAAVTGIAVGYWNYEGTAAANYIYAGDPGTSTNLVTTLPSGCAISAV